MLRDRHFTGRGTMDRTRRAYAIATAQVEKAGSRFFIRVTESSTSESEAFEAPSEEVAAQRADDPNFVDALSWRETESTMLKHEVIKLEEGS